MKTFAQHLHELKNRFLVCMGFLLLGCLVGLVFYKQIEAFLQKPLGQNLYYTTPVGGLGYVMQICLLVGAILALPIIMFEFAQFVRPVLKPIKTRLIILCIISSLILTVLGFLYAYVISLPAALHFLVTFNGPHVKPLINATDYLRFLFAYLLGTVAAFQLPLILFFMNKVRRFPPGTIWRVQRPFIVGAIVFAGIVTPTIDPINQMIVAIPIIALFEVGGMGVWLSNRFNRPAAKFEIKMPDHFVSLTEPQLTPVVPTRGLVAAAATPTRPSISQPVARRRMAGADILAPRNTSLAH